MGKEAGAWRGRQAPTERIFAATKEGLDPALWDGDRLRQSVRKPLLDRLNKVMREFDSGWTSWSRVYFAGSQASYWWGNGDIDILVGVDYDKARERVEEFAGLSDEEISEELNQAFRRGFNDEDYEAPWDGETYHLTAFNNLNSFEVSKIRPYAAYEILDGVWHVRPPHLPHWTPAEFPQGTGLWEYINGIANAIHGILAMPEPYRTREGAALWNFLHSHRSDAFNEEGLGWYDVPNVTEKYLDQIGLWGELYSLKQAYESGEYPRVEWTNMPRRASLAKSSAMVAICPPEGLLDHLLPRRFGENPGDLHLTLAILEDGHEPGHLAELADVVSEWAERLSPVSLAVQGIGTFVDDGSRGKHVLWASVDHPELHRLHDSLVMHLREYGYRVKADHGFTPHITLGYSPYHVRFLPKLDEKIIFSADCVKVHVTDVDDPDPQVYNVRLGVDPLREEG